MTIVFGRHRSDYIASLTAPAATRPVTLSEAKDHVKEDSSDNDMLLNRVIGAATRLVEAMAGKALITQTWTVSLPSPGPCNRFYLPVNPVIAITSGTYFDADNTSQELTVADFDLFKTDEWAYLEPKRDKAWPGIYARPDALTWVFTAGYGAAEAVPDEYKQAILIAVEDLFDVRGSSVIGASVSDPKTVATIQNLVGVQKSGFAAS